MPYIGLPLYHRRFPRVRADHRTSLGEDRRRRAVILVQKNFLSVRGLLGVGYAQFRPTTVSPPLPLPSVPFPSIFSVWIATRQAEGASISEVPSALGSQ